MNRYTRQIYGRKFSQASINFALREVTGGQLHFFRFFILLCTFSLAILAGSLAGVLSGYLSMILFYSSQPIEGVWVTASIVLVICVWSVETNKSTIIDGFWKAGLTVAFTSIGTIIAIPLESDLWFVTLLATSISLGCYCLVFIASSLSLSLVLVLLKRSLSRNVKTIHKFLIIILSTLISYVIANKPPVNFHIAYQYFVVIKLLAGFLIGVLTVKLSCDVSDINGNPKKNFEFFRNWAIAFSTLGSTSFYNLDLSSIDFTGAKLANTDLRARKLHRTCFQGVTGLERARVDSRYLDLENPKVQKLLTEGRSEDGDFSGLNLRGAYLQNAELRRFNFTDTDLTGADMQGADLRGSLLVRAQVIGVDFTNANLTGCCIQDWSINSQTCFTDVRCEYIYRKLDEYGEPIERFPSNRTFEPREFESLYQEVENVVELIFKEGENWRAALFSLRKLQLEDEELGLELKSIEKRGDLWVLKVTHNNAFPKQEVENRLNASFDEMKEKLASKEQQIDKLLDIVADQAKALKGYSKQPLGTSNNFFIVGSAITNLSGSGEIDYQEAANQVRNIVATSANSRENSSLASSLLDKFQDGAVAVNPTQQAELIEQIILAEAQKDTVFKQFLLLQGERISEAMPENAITSAIRNAIAQLNQPLP